MKKLFSKLLIFLLISSGLFAISLQGPYATSANIAYNIPNPLVVGALNVTGAISATTGTFSGDVTLSAGNLVIGTTAKGIFSDTSDSSDNQYIELNGGGGANRGRGGNIIVAGNEAPQQGNVILNAGNGTGAASGWGQVIINAPDDGAIATFGSGATQTDKSVTFAGSISATTGTFSGLLKHSQATKTAAYTASTEEYLFCDATSAAFTITLPAVSAGLQYTIKKVDAVPTHDITIDGNGAETIDGAATQALTTQWDVITIVSDGTAWFTI